MTSRYEILFVDWDGTLSGSRFWGHWATHPVHAKKYKALQQQLFMRSDDTLHRWMRGEFTVEEVVELAATRTGIDAQELIQSIETSCKEMDFFDPRLPQLLGEARKLGLKVVMATDNMDTFTRWTVPALRLNELCDDILDSHALRTLKRDKAGDGSSKFFSKYLAQHGVAPERTVLLDDSIANRVVKEFGIDYIGVTPRYPAVQALADLLSTS